MLNEHLLLEDKRPLRAKLHTAHMLRWQRFMNLKPPPPPPPPPAADLRPLWQRPVLIQQTFNPVRLIQRLVSETYNVTFDDLLGNGRTNRVVHPRHVAMYLSKTLTRCSLTDIGRRFGGRDHTTVIHALHSIEQQYQEDAELRRTVHQIKESFHAAME